MESPSKRAATIRDKQDELRAQMIYDSMNRDGTQSGDGVNSHDIMMQRRAEETTVDMDDEYLEALMKIFDQLLSEEQEEFARAAEDELNRDEEE